MLTISNSTEPLLEYFMHRNSTKSQAIYLAVLVIVVLTFALLPFIKVSITVQGAGIIRPVSEKTEVKSLANDLVEQVFVKEYQTVSKNTPLIQLRTNTIDSKLMFLQYQKAEILSFINDLTLLTQQKTERLRSPVYQQEYFYFFKQTEELKNKCDKTKKEYERNKKLYNNAVISEKDFDDLRFQFSTAENEYKINHCNQLNKWQNDLSRYKKSLMETETSITQLLKEKEFYTIKAPVSGTVEQFSGIYAGSSVSSGQTIAIISPDSTLLTEVYISPKDIGYINQTNSLKIQVDAFNYNEWGLLAGTVKEISSDFMLINNTAMFKVKCSLNSSYLTLKNGIRGNIKKGMSVRAHFLVAKRSLFQLLYQNIDDWMNPTQYKGQNLP